MERATAALETADAMIDMMSRRGHALVNNDVAIDGTLWALGFDNGTIAVMMHQSDVNMDMAERLRELDIDSLIVVYCGKLTPAAKQLLGHVELWEDTKLRCNPFQFNFITTATIVAPRPDAHTLPKLFLTDPLCRYLDAKVGDIVEVEISNQTKHRVVIENPS